MSIKFYLSEWFYNMGIVGLLRILKFNNVDESKYTTKENYLEIEDELLDNFAEYYFNYFFTINDDRERFITITNKATNLIINYEKPSASSDREVSAKDISEAIKNVYDYFKKYENSVKNTSYVDEFNDLLNSIKEMNSLIKKDTSIETLESAKSILNNLSDFVSIEEIRKKRAANITRSNLSDFFGQASFLNPSFVGAYAQNFIEKMHKDYVEPVKEKYNQNASKKSKGKTVYNCSLCSRETNGKYHFDEAMFSPIGLSLTENKNFLWNEVTKLPICEECRLLLMCTPVGCTPLKKYRSTIDGVEYYTEYTFVNLDTDINSLFKINENFRQRSSSSNPYRELIFDIVTQMEQKALWTLQSIFFVEFQTDKKSTYLRYFNIAPFKAKFFIDKEVHYLLSHIRPYQFQMDIMEYILTDRDLYLLIFDELRNYLKKAEGKRGDRRIIVGDPISCFNSVCLRHLLNGYKRRQKKVSTKIINDAFEYGKELNRYYVATDSANKINSIGYKMLNAVKVGDKEEFLDNLIRTCMSIQKPIPDFFLNVLTEQRADFKDIALAFICGFTALPVNVASKEKVSNEEV